MSLTITEEIVLSEKTAKIIESVVRHMPDNIKDDCRQAAYLAILKLVNTKPQIDSSIYGYIRHVANGEALREYASLYPIYSINHYLLCQYIKYKKNKAGANISEDTIKKLDNTKQIYLSDLEGDDND